MTSEGDSLREPRAVQSFWVQCLTWLLAGVVVLLAAWGGLRYRHGWNLQRAANTRGFKLTVEPSTTPALRAWFGEELARPLDRVMELIATDPASEDLPLVSGLPSLRSLTLTSQSPQGLPDLGVVSWRGMMRLEALDLRSPRLDLSPVQFESLTSLKRLSLTSPDFRGAEGLKLPASLRTVHVVGQLAPELLASIARLPDLQDVYLLPTLDGPLPSDWVASLHGLRARSLHLAAHRSPSSPSEFTGTVPSDQISWEGLARLNGLKSLHIDCTDLGRKEIATLAESSRVGSLSLHYVRWEPGAVEPVSGFPRLESLSIHGRDGQFVTRLLTQLPVLKHLSVGLWTITLDQEFLHPLAEIPSLTTLRFSSPVNQSGLEELGRFPALEALQVHGPELNPAVLAKLTTLQSLEVDSGRMRTGREQLESLSKLPALRNLHIGPLVDPSGIAVLAGYPSLEELRLTGDLFQPDDLKPLAQSATLKRLDIRGTPAAKNISATWLKTHLPGVDVQTKWDYER